MWCRYVDLWIWCSMHKSFHWDNSVICWRFGLNVCPFLVVSFPIPLPAIPFHIFCSLHDKSFMFWEIHVTADTNEVLIKSFPIKILLHFCYHILEFSSLTQFTTWSKEDRHDAIVCILLPSQSSQCVENEYKCMYMCILYGGNDDATINCCFGSIIWPCQFNIK